MTTEPSIRVELDAAEEGDDLLEALSVRGLRSRVVRDEAGRVEVEVAAPEDNPGLWNLEIVTALEGWLAESERSSVVARLDRHAFTVRAPRPLPERPAPRPAAEPRPDEDRTTRMPALTPAEPVGRRRPSTPVLLGAAGVALVALIFLWLLVSIAVRLL